MDPQKDQQKQKGSQNSYVYKFDKKIDKYAYSLKNLLGKGQFGQVVLGQDCETEQLVAVKVIDLSSFKSSHNFVLLNREIQILQNVESEYIIKLFDVIQSQSSNNLYMFLDFCKDGDLKKCMQERGGKLPYDQALNFFRQIVGGFKVLYEKGVIHRDIKPANIMIKNGKALIGDFGFARYLDIPQNQQANFSCLGTPLYMCPQILRADKFSAKCDVWSVGILFYEMIYGKTPFNGKTKEQLYHQMENQNIEFPSTVPEIPEETKKLILSMLGFEEENRISWEEVFQHSLVTGNQNKNKNENLRNNSQISLDNKENLVCTSSSKNSPKESPNSSKTESQKQEDDEPDYLLESNEIQEQQGQETIKANVIKDFNKIQGGIQTLRNKKK